MFETKKTMTTMTTMVFGAAALLATACGGQAGHDDGDPGAPPDLRSGFSAEGLTIESSTSDEVTGRFERHGAAIRFDVSRDGDTRHLHVASASGDALVDSTLANGIDVSEYFAGKARAKGPIDGAEPTREGDESVFAALAASPEARLLPELKEALYAAHVDEAIFRPKIEATRAGELAPKSWYDGYWWHLAFNQSYGFWSWSWWGWTTVMIASEADPNNGFAAAAFHAGCCSTEYVDGWGTQYYRRQWWGAYVTVTNDWAPLCSPDGSCQNTTILARNY